ncbi:MAG: hypothetical protein JXA21_09375 [Anaerolineae bacterium]|nr:hypothetical protein [Anaerolineae bacterium]
MPYPPTTQQHLFLFDIDSVLVEALGYLHALQDTVRHFAQRMGMGNHAPTADEIRAGEAFGLTSEWDSAPTYIAALLIERLRYSTAPILPNHWEGALKTLAAHPQEIPHPDYTALVTRIGTQLQTRKNTAAQAAHEVLEESAGDLPQPQRIPISALLEALFNHTHDFAKAPITKHFQHLVIGSHRIRDTYGVDPTFDAPPYLRDHDLPLLNAQTRNRLLAQMETGGLRLALYTARPSLPPCDVEATQRGYSPEAEMARSLVGLESQPLIGLGRLQWLAKQVNVDVEALVKPSPVQALAAIGAAFAGQEASALKAAWALRQNNSLMPPLSGLDAATVHVFEDSGGGLQAVKHAIEQLNAAGKNIHYRPYGITPETGAKATVMDKLGVQTYPTINDAIVAALASRQ